MNKRDFLAAAIMGSASLPALARAPTKQAARKTPTLLTIAGAIGLGNRGAMDPVLDQLMKKQGVNFHKAHSFDFAALLRLPAVTIRPTLEYDARVHTLRGTLVADVIGAAGAQTDAKTTVLLRGIDGYAVQTTMADIQRYRMMVATHLDGAPMPLGGVGPLWAVYDADRFADRMAMPLADRYSSCPWGLYFIDLQSG